MNSLEPSTKISFLTECLIKYEFCSRVYPAMLLSLLIECYFCIVVYSHWFDKKDEENAALEAALEAALFSVQANTGLQDHTQPMTTSQKAATINASS